MAHRLRNAALIAGIVAGAVALLALAVAGSQVATGAWAVLLAFVLPGYAISAALFPHGALRLPERALLVLALSVAVIILGGLALNVTPWGLQTKSWIVLLVGVSLVAGAVAVIRRRTLQEVVTLAPQTHAGIGLPQALVTMLALLIAIAAFKYASIPAPAQGIQGYTLLWMLPPQTNQAGVIQFGIESKELTQTQYSLQLKVEGQVVYEWKSISLAPNEQWRQNVQLSVSGLANGAPVEALLYRQDAPGNPYRQAVWQYSGRH